MSQTKVKDGLLNFPDRDDFIQLPSGTTAQRPSSPEQGYSRYNTTDKKLEFWNGTEWQQLPGLVPPIITSLSYPGDDLAADPVGGQTITINGGDFKAGATVTVGGTTPSVITFVSATQITFEAPAKAAGDYDVVVTNTDGGNATSVNGMAYNGVPSWTTAAGNLGTFPAGSTIPTITLVATEPDSGTISYSVTTGALPTGLTLTGADIDGSVPTPAGETTYNFSVTASDDENQESTERAFNIVVYIQVTNTVDEVDPFDGNGVALYKLDGDATDESGNYNGTASASLTYTTGLFGQAGLFQNNTNFNVASIDHITMSDITGSTSFSVSLWAKLATIVEPNGGSLVSLVSNTNSTYQLALYAGDNTERFFRAGFGADGTLTAQNTYNFMLDNQWHHIVNVYTGGVNSKVYVDGALVSTVASSSAQTMLINEISKSGGSKGGFNGSIDQVRIFNEALTPLEVQSLYEELKVVCGGQAETVDILGDNSCIALYPLDGNANDLSGNYSGTPTDVSYGVGDFDLSGVFNGSSSRITTTASQLPIPASGAFTVSFWAKVDSSLTQYNICMMSFGDFWIKSEYLTGRFGLGDVNPGYETTSSMGYVWNHCVLTVDASNNINLYLNGANEFTGNKSISRTNGGNFAIGVARLSSPVYYFNGELDQVRIFNKALSSSEVTTLYNETACDALACSGTTNTLDILGDSSCIAAYPLDGSPLDLSGNYNGVQTDVTYPVGKFDLGGYFNGSSSVLVGSVGGLFTSKTTSSVSLWFKSTSSEGGNRWLFADYDSASFNYVVYLNSPSVGKIRFLSRYSSATTTIDSVSSGLNDGNWHHLVVMVDILNLKNRMYIDGTFESEGNLSSNGYNASGALGYIGGGIIGQMDQVRIFNKALSAGEVTTLYNETACN